MSIRRILAFGLLTSVSVIPFTGSAVAEPVIQLGIGVEYSSGEYGGTDDTTIYEIPFTARLRTGDWSFRARIPYVSVDGPGGVIPGEDDGSRSGRGQGIGGATVPITPVLPTTAVNDSGIGDISLSATYTYDWAEKSYLDLTGKVSLPTGDEDKDLGVGETDYTLKAELGRDMEDGGAYVTGGYKVRGGSARDDGALAAVGGYGRFGNGVIVGAEASWSEAAYGAVDDAASVTGYTSFRVSDDLRMSLFAETGLTDNAPDLSAGVALTWRTNFRRPFQTN